jgi:hypothetical protein
MFSPIYTYSGRGTTKRGVHPQEHAIAYSWGHTPALTTGESGITLPSIPVVMADAQPALHAASRIYFGLTQPIQYNVKVKEVGYVPQDYTHTLLANWRTVDGEGLEAPDVTAIDLSQDAQTIAQGDLQRAGESTRNTCQASEGDEVKDAEATNMHMQKLLDTLSQTQLGSLAAQASEDGVEGLDLELASNPKGFFKKGRVFMTRWAEPRGFSVEPPFVEMSRFVVIKPHQTFSICLRISTYSGQATTKSGAAANFHAAVIPAGGTFTPHPQGENLEKDPVEVKVEDAAVTIDPMSRIHFAKAYTVEHNLKVRNIGVVVGDSVGLLDNYFAESLGYNKP